jgi:hypothetical protein
MKSKHRMSSRATESVASPVPPSLNRPTHGEISALARVIWENRGEPQGEDAAIWLDAERRLLIGSGADDLAVVDTRVLLGEPTGTIEDRLQAFGESSGGRSATSL